MCHHTNLGLDWKAAGTDDSFRSFRTSFAQSVEDGELSATQVELKLDHVFKFYRNIRKAMPFVGLMPTPQFVGKPANLTPITSRLANGKIRWSGWSKVDRSAPRQTHARPRRSRTNPRAFARRCDEAFGRDVETEVAGICGRTKLARGVLRGESPGFGGEKRPIFH